MSQQDPTGNFVADLKSIESAAQTLGDFINSQDSANINSNMRALTQLIYYAKEGREEMSPTSAEMKHIDKRMDDMQKEINRIKKWQLWARMIPLFLVALAIVAYPFYGMVTHMPPQSLVEYMAPISGLAGAIIGYWFGQREEGR
jgi:hypothetical protein